MSKQRFDLHLHTTASDGALSPEEVVERCAGEGLMCIAVTDHDTTAGLAAARQAGGKLGLPVIPGAELAADSKTELHILGYGMDTESEAWREFAREQQRRRAERNERMLERLEALGLVLPEEFMPENVPGEYGRMHMALGLVCGGTVSSVRQAFEQYLGWNAPAYVPRRKFASSELIPAIRGAGGQAVLAHPGRMGMGLKETGRLIGELKDQGLDGVEAYYPLHEPEEAEYYARAAASAGLVCTFGSDWHGEPDAGPALSFGRFHIPDATVAWLEGLLRKQGDSDAGGKAGK